MRSTPLSFLLLAVLSAAADAEGIEWLDDLDRGLERAKEQRRAVLVLFTGSDWCRPCQMLEERVLSTEAFAKFAAERFVPVRLDFPMQNPLPEEQAARNKKWSERYGIEGFPTLLVLDADGGERGRLVGFDPKWGVEEVEKRLREFLEAKEPDWLTDFEEAKRRAAESGRPILADFTGSDWCGWCKKLKKEVFDTPRFRSWATQKVVLLEIDFPKRKPQPEKLAEQNRRLLERYGVEGFPTILFLDAEGNVLGELGYLKGGAENWIRAADAILLHAEALRRREQKEKQEG